MSNCAAKIELGWTNQCYEAESPCGIIREVEKEQDFGCLVRMGRMMGTTEDQKVLNKLEKFLEKYYNGDLTMSDIKKINFRLSIGDFVCHGIAETEEEIEKLRD